MKTLRLDAGNPEHVKQAAAILDGGGLVAFGTETVYGLGCDALNATAAAKVFEAKGRPTFDPLIVHVPHPAQVARVAVMDPRAEALAAAFWPGPMTLVLPKLPHVPDLVTAGLPTVAVRVPQSPAARALLAACRNPVAAPSANLFGHVSPTTAAHVLRQLDGRVDAVLDAGPCAVGLESTIVGLAGERPALLRPGAVTHEMLEKALGCAVALADAPSDTPQAPGQLARHYATRTPLTLVGHNAGFVPPAGQRAGLLAFAPPTHPEAFEATALLTADHNLVEAAAGLFAGLRALDDLGLDHLYAQTCPEHGIGRAIMNRLKRAAARE